MTSKDTTVINEGALSQVVHNVIAWAFGKNFDLLYNSVAQDEDFFIFHPDSKSTIRGFEAFHNLAENSWKNPAFRATHYEIRDLKITLSTSGTVAWYSCFLDDFGEWNGRESGWLNARWTGVLEQREGKWVHTQMHFSLPTDRE